MSDHETFDDEELTGDETGREIAIVGMAGRFPGGRDLHDFWSNLEGGVEAIRTVDDETLLAAGVPRATLSRPDYVKAVSSIEGVEEFDADFFGYNARDAEIMDPQQRLFLEHAWAALEDAGHTPARYDGMIGVYAGVAWNTYLLSNLMAHPELFDGVGGFQVFITNDKDFMPTRVAYKLDLKGPAMIVQTSCSTSLVATHLACLGLQSYECDMALVGGVTVKVPSEAGYFYQEGGLASPDGHCRTFDAGAGGTVFGSGIGVVALKRLADAIDDGDTIRAVIKGSAINNDGSVKVSYTAPSVEGQAEVIAAAQEMAGVEPDTIRYVECHGTATSLGDPIEVRALAKVFGEATERKGFCALGSVKSNVGHLDAAAGVAGLIKTSLALQERKIPPSLHFETPNPAIDFASSPFYVAQELEEWTADGDTPRRAGVSSFGVGGTNAHVILEEAPEPDAAEPSRAWQWLTLSARSEGALGAMADNLRQHLERQKAASAEGGGLHLADVAHTLGVGREVFRHRLSVVCQDLDEAVAALAGDLPGRRRQAVDTAEPRERPVAFLFSGQGSQYPGMGRGLYDSEPVFREVIDRCAEVLQGPLGADLRHILWPADDAPEDAAARLGQTRFTQPALFAVEVALAAQWRAWGVEPQAMLGHSIGEFVAAHLAGVMTLEEGLTLVAARGRLMDELPGGGMLAVPLAEDALVERLANHPELSLAAINEPERCVVSGPEDALTAFADELASGDSGIEGRRLHTSHAFHSAMMEPALEAFGAEVRKIELQAPQIPFVSNLSGTWITDEEATDPGYWVRHLRSAVRFADGVATLADDADRLFVEVGPGRALATLTQRHPALGGGAASPRIITSLRHPQDSAEGLGADPAHMLDGLGRLWLAGLDLDPAALFGEEMRRRVPLPTYPFEGRRYWIEPTAHHGAPGSGASASVPASATRQLSDMGDWFHLPSFKPTAFPRSSTEGLPASWLLLTGDTLAAACTAALVERGVDRDSVIRVGVGAAGSGLQSLGAGSYTLDPADPQAFGGLLTELRASLGAAPRAVLFGWPLDEDAAADAAVVTDAASFDAAQIVGGGALLRLISALTAAGGAVDDLTVVGNGLVRIGAGESARPEKATLRGLCRVLPQEVPGLRCRVVDAPVPRQIDDAGRLAERLIDEVSAAAQGRVDDEVLAYRGRRRLVEAFEPLRLDAVEAPDSALRQGGTYVLSGGLQGNGYAFARHLARAFGARLVLVEGEEPADAAADRVRSLGDLGAEVATVVGDLADDATWRRALDTAVERFTAVHGILHTAGTDGEQTFRALAEIDAEHLAAHFEPKVHGTLALERALEAWRGDGGGGDLDFCLLLSSLASVLGGLAYGAYTAANAFLDAFVDDRGSRSSIPWLSLRWDVWEFEDEVEQITALRSDLAELAMTPRQGEEALGRLLMADLDAVLVSTGDLRARLDERRQRILDHTGGASTGAGPDARHPRPELGTPFAPAESDLERRIVGVWQEFLGFEEIGIDDNFFELGGDSFIAVRVAARLREVLEVELPVAQLYQRLTVRSLAELLATDAAAATEERAAHLAERRESMDRRKSLLKRRRSRR